MEAGDFLVTISNLCFYQEYLDFSMALILHLTWEEGEIILIIIMGEEGGSIGFLL